MKKTAESITSICLIFVILWLGLKGNKITIGWVMDERLNNERQKELRRRIERSEDFDQIFEIVKEVVHRDIREHRAGLSLLLSDMPSYIGAYHPVGSNAIVINRTLINALRKIVTDPRELNYFIFTLLMHEYLHSLGHLDDTEVRAMVANICRRSLGEDHISVRMADGNWIEKYPELRLVEGNFSKEFELVRKFDSSSKTYFA
ncbi:MAG: hypothetical protein QXG05_08485 [Nitrososphaerota archaeon]